ncbi:MAG: phosphoribosylformylglycinamidine synthase subunit PurQ [Acidimicrobiales bacterium]
MTPPAPGEAATGGAGPKVAVVVFPGSNCEHDVVQAVSSFGARAELVWHTEHSVEGFDAIIVPGGFAHGDYLRPGAIARFSPVMDAVSEAAAAGVPVLGICNGFQVLTEAHLLPGALMRNAGGRFVCQIVECEVVSTSSVLTAGACLGQRLRLPVNHFEGNYACALDTLQALERSGQIPLRYVNNPNGSMSSIAAVANREGNVVGLMPHPERAATSLMGSADGRVLLQSFLEAAALRTGRSGADAAAVLAGA